MKFGPDVDSDAAAVWGTESPSVLADQMRSEFMSKPANFTAEPKLMGLLVQACVMWIYNATPEDFVNVFGKVGNHLWRKFEGQYDRQEGQLICGMDCFNAEKLAVAAWEKYGPELREGRASAEEVELVAAAIFATRSVVPNQPGGGEP